MPTASLSCPDFLLFLQRLVGPGGEGRAGQRADDEDPEAGHGRGVAGEERHQRGAEGARVGQGTVLSGTGDGSLSHHYGFSCAGSGGARNRPLSLGFALNKAQVLVLSICYHSE